MITKGFVWRGVERKELGMGRNRLYKIVLRKNYHLRKTAILLLSLDCEINLTLTLTLGTFLPNLYHLPDPAQSILERFSE